MHRWLREYRYRAAHPMTHWQYEQEEPPELVDLFLLIAYNDTEIAKMSR